MNNAQMYCLCLKNGNLNVMKKLDYIPVGLGNDNFSDQWIRDNTLDNISHKNKYYGEYTFHYWFWKNKLNKIKDGKWIGFCAYREYWGNSKKVRSSSLLEDMALKEIPKEWENFDTIVGEHFFINNLKFSKLIKHGLISLMRNPSALIKSKRNIRFHFDMWHGNGNLDKAIDLLDEKDREDFRKYTRENISFSRGNMFISNSNKRWKYFLYR